MVLQGGLAAAGIAIIIILLLLDYFLIVGLEHTNKTFDREPTTDPSFPAV